MELQKESEKRGWPPASMIDQTIGGVENNARAGAETSFFKFHTICSQNPCSGSIIRKSYIILMHAKKTSLKISCDRTKQNLCTVPHRACWSHSLRPTGWGWVINDMWWMTYDKMTCDRWKETVTWFLRWGMTCDDKDDPVTTTKNVDSWHDDAVL